MTKTSKIVSIPKEKLHEGFNECQHKVNDLLKSSQILFDATQFNESLALSILATEETTKLSIILDHIKEGAIIESNDWSEITTKRGMHIAKLTKIQKDSKQQIEKMAEGEFENLPRIKKSNISRTHAIKQLQILEDMYAKLGEIKNACFYVNWKTDWSTLSIYFSNVQDRKDLAYYYLTLGWLDYYSIIFILKYDVDISDVKNYASHPYLKQYLKFRKISRSKEFLQLYEKIKQLLNTI
ncbi:MAG: AbiV family abortive infection protein [Thaumarchaeota archaeon]|nr:AbiV family abortive infection protein [Nitrososphaerota archaeon]